MTTTHLPPLPTSPTAPTTVLETTLTLVRPPEDVFPLLCPVLEYLWIPDWSCTMVHSHSGVAELGCVFLREQGETWLTTRYEPPTAIDYAIVAPGLSASALQFRLSPTAQGTSVALRSTHTALSPEGAAWLAGWTVAQQRAMWSLREAQANHYLTTGTMLEGPRPTYPG